METFAKLFERFLVLVYHCFDRIVIQGYLPLHTRPEHIVHFFRDVHGLYLFMDCSVLFDLGAGFQIVGAKAATAQPVAAVEIH
jgi:hypothetical protein